MASSDWRAALAREAGHVDDPLALRAAFARMLGVDEGEVANITIKVGDFADWMGRMFTLLEISGPRSHSLRDTTAAALGGASPPLGRAPPWLEIHAIHSLGWLGSPCRGTARMPLCGPGLGVSGQGVASGN